MPKNNILTIGIAGGSGCGKTLIVESVIEHFPDQVCYLKMDNYYKSHDDLDFEERKKINFDSPDAFDMDLLYEHLHKLQNGEAVHTPIYNFKVHNRSSKTALVEPKKIIIIDGILALYFKDLVSAMDTRIFVDVDDDIRILRRIRRDIDERGRTLASVFEQYIATVKPMYEKYIKPSKLNANLIIPQGGYNKVAISVMIDHIEKFLEQKESETNKFDSEKENVIEVK